MHVGRAVSHTLAICPTDVLPPVLSRRHAYMRSDALWYGYMATGVCSPPYAHRTAEVVSWLLPHECMSVDFPGACTLQWAKPLFHLPSLDFRWLSVVPYWSPRLLWSRGFRILATARPKAVWMSLRRCEPLYPSSSVPMVRCFS